MSETLNEYWFPQVPNSSSSSSSFGYSSMASSDTNSSTTQITPTNSPPKPIKRRSRSSKRTPTTLLNANTTNFRSLVQQFTGYHQPETNPNSLIGSQKGPVNLNFQLGSVSLQNNNDNYNSNQSVSYDHSGFGSFSSYDHNQYFQTQVQLQQKQQVVEENVLSENGNIFQTRISEAHQVGLDDLDSMIMGDGVNLMDDDVATDFQPLSDQGFFWNIHNQFPS